MATQTPLEKQTMSDRLVLYFSATEKLLNAADEVRRAGDALLTTTTPRNAAAQESRESEVSHG